MAKEKATDQTTTTEKQLSVLIELEKKFGKGIVQKFTDKVDPVASISTGSIGLDFATGIGGFPQGRISVVYGEQFTGKTYLCLQTIAHAQSMGLRCAVIDTEHALDTTSAQLMGVDMSELYICQPDSANDALEVVEALVKSKDFGLLVLDSVAAMATKEEIDGDYGDAIVGRKAKLMAQACRRLVPLLSETGCTLLATNQLIDNIGAFGFQETTTMPGGKVLKFAASMIVELKKIQSIKEAESVVGHMVRATVKKNKVAIPFKVAEYEITYGANFIKQNEVLKYAEELSLVERSGAWYSYKGERIGQGRANVKKYLADNPTVCSELEDKIRLKLSEK